MIDNILEFETAKKIKKRWIMLDQEKYVFFVNLLFYFSLLLFNPSNKLIIASSLLLFLIYNYKFKNFKLSLILCYLTSLIVLSGKTYDIELVPKNLFSDIFNQVSFSIFVTINTPLIISILMFLIFLRDFILKRIPWKNTKTDKKDIFLFFYFTLVMFTNAFISKRPEISMLASLTEVSTFIAYLFVKFYKPPLKKIVPIVIAIFASQLIIESSMTIQQSLLKSPLNKNIESHSIFQSGNIAPDEIGIGFRPVGTMIHANNLASWLVFFIFVVFTYNYGRVSNFYSLTILLSLVALILTLSRSAWGVFYIGFIFLLTYFERIKKIRPPSFIKHIKFKYLLVGIILIILFAFPRLEKSIYIASGGLKFRENQLTAATALIRDNFIFGAGTSMSIPTAISGPPKAKYLTMQPLPIHNWYLTMLIEHGFFALFFLLLYIVFKLRAEIHYLSSQTKFSNSDTLKVGLVIGVMAQLAISFFQPFFMLDVIMICFALLT